MIADYSRCTVTTPDTSVPVGRFVFYKGSAAVWVENKRERTAQRVLFATGATFTKSARARLAHTLELPTGEVWEIRQVSGGCGCNSKLKSFSVEKLVDPEFSSF